MTLSQVTCDPHTAENENSVPYSRIFVSDSIGLPEVSNRIEFFKLKMRVKFCPNYYYYVGRYAHILLVP